MCTSFDFDYLTSGSRCFWFTGNAAELALFTPPAGSRIDHFVRNNCSDIQTS